jgi:hypothetical protein
MKEGEYTEPQPLDSPELQKITDIPIKDEKFSAFRDMLVNSLKKFYVIYYKPKSWTPAFKIEIDSGTAGDEMKLQSFLAAFGYQCYTNGISMPYPLYNSSKMVCSLKNSMDSINETVFLNLTKNHPDDAGEIYSLINFRDINKNT